jgi:hypothetical protein
MRGVLMSEFGFTVSLSTERTHTMHMYPLLESRVILRRRSIGHGAIEHGTATQSEGTKDQTGTPVIQPSLPPPP